ncbi:uL13 family ribosomal protein, partial [archaeon]|nr:uL13 family ribosomal protein [archaeon]
MNINAENLILGRVATYAAKKALMGETVNVVNCDKIIITGSKKQILDRYLARIHKGSRPTKGPFFPKTSERIVKRTIRGMLPYKQYKG